MGRPNETRGVASNVLFSLSKAIFCYKVFNVKFMLVPTAASATVTLLQLTHGLKPLIRPNSLHVVST